MTIAEIVALVPEDKRTQVELDLTKLQIAAKVENKEQAEQVIRENPLFRAVIDATVSKEVAVHDNRFVAERLPSIVEAEIKKRNPTKDPRDIALEEMQAKLSDMEKATIRERQRGRAIGKLAEQGLSDKLADFYLGDSDDVTDSKLQMLFEAITPWKERALESTLKERFGNMPVPPAGKPPVPIDLKSQLDKAMADGNADLALALQSKLQFNMNGVTK